MRNHVSSWELTCSLSSVFFSHPPSPFHLFHLRLFPVCCSVSSSLSTTLWPFSTAQAHRCRLRGVFAPQSLRRVLAYDVLSSQICQFSSQTLGCSDFTISTNGTLFGGRETMVGHASIRQRLLRYCAVPLRTIILVMIHVSYFHELLINIVTWVIYLLSINRHVLKSDLLISL